jgi:hypothetical protein
MINISFVSSWPIWIDHRSIGITMSSICLQSQVTGSNGCLMFGALFYTLMTISTMSTGPHIDVHTCFATGKNIICFFVTDINGPSLHWYHNVFDMLAIASDRKNGCLVFDASVDMEFMILVWRMSDEGKWQCFELLVKLIMKSCRIVVSWIYILCFGITLIGLLLYIRN